MNDELPLTIIEARPLGLRAQMRALWQHRAFYSFLFTEITMKKFRGTLLGFWWLVLRPLIASATIVIVFTSVVPLKQQDLPYPIFFLIGFTTFTAFQATLTFMPRTLLWMQGLMKRTYFPRLLVPAASLGPPLVEVGITLGLLFAALSYFGLHQNAPLKWGPAMFLFPVCLILALSFAWSIGMVMSVVALFFRDVVFSVSYFSQLFLLATPIIYPMSSIPSPWRSAIYIVNPLAQLVEASRWSLTASGDFQPHFFIWSTVIILLVLVASLTFFLRAEQFLADEI